MADYSSSAWQHAGHCSACDGFKSSSAFAPVNQTV